jgi:hypothetical protein
MPWVIAIAAVVACIALAVWATALRSDLADANDRADALTAEQATLRESATAAVYDLSPTAQGPENASGTMFLTASGSGVLNVVNMPALEDGMAYQLWFLPPDEGEPIPGSTFTVDDRGVGFTLIAADVGSFRGVSISLEPEAGSAAPTGPQLLSGAGAGARG